METNIEALNNEVAYLTSFISLNRFVLGDTMTDTLLKRLAKIKMMVDVAKDEMESETI